MRKIISLLFVVLGAMSLLALWLKPRDTDPTKTQLTWTTAVSNFERGNQISKFNELHPDFLLTGDENNSTPQKVLIQCCTGVGPDLFDTSSDILQTYIDADIAYDVTDAAKKMGFSMDGQLWPNSLTLVGYKGRQYGYPANMSIKILIYNKDLFDQYGVPYPKSDMTWEEFIEMKKKFNTGSEKNPVFGVSSLKWRDFFDSEKGELFSEDGTRLNLTGDSMKKAFQMHWDMIFKHHISLTTLKQEALSAQGGWGNGPINLFAEEQFASIVIGKWSLIAFRKFNEDRLRKLKKWEASSDRDPAKKPKLLRLGAVKCPHFPGMPPSYSPQARIVVINAKSPRRDQALKFLQYLAGSEYSFLINRGVDSIPANPEHSQLGLENKFPELGEMEMHQATMETMKFAYQRQLSPFLNVFEVYKELDKQIARMESNPDLKIETLLQNAQTELEYLMQRNLDRSPELKKYYIKLTGSDKVLGFDSKQIRITSQFYSSAHGTK